MKNTEKDSNLYERDRLRDRRRYILLQSKDRLRDRKI